MVFETDKKSLFFLERSLGPSFALDNTTDFTETDTTVNEGQLSLAERGERGLCESELCLLKSLEYTDVRNLKLDQRQLWMHFMHYICEFEYKCQGDG